MVAGAVYLLSLLVILYVRLDFSIDKDEASESKLRFAGHCETILALQDRRISSYNKLDDLLTNLKSNKDVNVNVYLTAVKSVNQLYKNATAVVALR